MQFALCGSSARKVKRGQANLLGGRAMRYELHGLTAQEIGEDFDLIRVLNHGYLPRMYQSDRPMRLLNAYVADYLKEEVAAEGLVRNLPVYSEFLKVAALSDTELVNFSTIARNCGVSSQWAQSSRPTAFLQAAWNSSPPSIMRMRSSKEKMAGSKT